MSKEFIYNPLKSLMFFVAARRVLDTVGEDEMLEEKEDLHRFIGDAMNEARMPPFSVDGEDLNRAIEEGLEMARGMRVLR